VKITLICPSRGRPARFVKMAESAQLTAYKRDQLHISLGLDEDDETAPEYARLMPHGVTLQVFPKGMTVPALMNVLARGSRGDIVMAASDDIVFRTPGWDEKVRHAFKMFPDRMLVAYTNDGRDRDKCEHFFVSRAWMQAVGWFMWPGFSHFCADEMVERVGRKAGRTLFLRDVVTEHMHFKYGKADKDETYASKRRIDISAQDQALLIELDPEVHAAAARVTRVIDESRIAA